MAHNLSELPPRDTTRWTRRRKAAVVIAVAEGIISTQAALERYGLSAQEFAEWSRRDSQYGMRVLLATKRLPKISND